MGIIFYDVELVISSIQLLLHAMFTPKGVVLVGSRTGTFFMIESVASVELYCGIFSVFQETTAAGNIFGHVFEPYICFACNPCNHGVEFIRCVHRVLLWAWQHVSCATWHFDHLQGILTHCWNPLENASSGQVSTSGSDRDQENTIESTVCINRVTWLLFIAWVIVCIIFPCLATLCNFTFNHNELQWNPLLLVNYPQPLIRFLDDIIFPNLLQFQYSERLCTLWQDPFHTDHTLYWTRVNKIR